jgi:predicted transposase YbfD/YdcC
MMAAYLDKKWPMTQQQRSIIDFFGEVEDERRDNANREHELVDILVVALCGMLGGADDWVSIAEYGREKEDWFRQFLALPNGIPSHDTFNRVFRFLDANKFIDCFSAWVDSLGEILGKQVVAIDGKTLRRSHDRGNSKAAIHMVSAWATANKLVLGQVKTTEKSNEITAIPELLESLAIEGCLVTIDAMGCQKAIAQTIIDKKADYLLAVKGNQPKLQAAIEATLDHRLPKVYQRPAIDFFEQEETNRGRHEIRRCWVTQSLGKLDMASEWEGLVSIAMLESERTVDEKTSIERRYYICSCDPSAESLYQASRSHWGVENSLHWVLDMAFREGECRVRKGNGAENLARLRHFALNMLKQDKTTKLGVKNKRLKAGWSNDYLLQLLNIELRVV